MYSTLNGDAKLIDRFPGYDVDLLGKELQDNTHHDEHEGQAAHDAEQGWVVVRARGHVGVWGVLYKNIFKLV